VRKIRHEIVPRADSKGKKKLNFTAGNRDLIDWGSDPSVTLLLYAVQGWSSVTPRFSLVDFLSFYIELLVMAIMYILWLALRRALRPRAAAAAVLASSPTTAAHAHAEARPFFDFVDVSRVDLHRDEHEETQVDKHEDEVRAQRLRGRAGWAWTLYYIVA
jgi:amino acid permease